MATFSAVDSSQTPPGILAHARPTLGNGFGNDLRFVKKFVYKKSQHLISLVTNKGEIQVTQILPNILQTAMKV